jgi:hypothetical protein
VFRIGLRLCSLLSHQFARATNDGRLAEEGEQVVARRAAMTCAGQSIAARNAVVSLIKQLAKRPLHNPTLHWTEQPGGL